MKNLGQLMKQAQQMQQKMADMQAQLETVECVGVAGGGLVQVTLNGKSDLKKIKIDKSVLDPEEAEVVEDLIVAAFNDAKQKVAAHAEAEMHKLTGGLNLLAKLLGKPGKMDVDGEQVYAMHQAGRWREINEYCMFDTLDTYFVFLRTRVLRGDISLPDEQGLVAAGKAWIRDKSVELPALRTYLEAWDRAHP